MKVARQQVAVQSFVYEAGRTEDGERFVAEGYFVQVTLRNGERWDHRVAFKGAVVHTDPESGYQYFEDVRAAALRAALRLRRRVRAAGAIDLDHWSPGRPVYGSAAYDGEAELALERADEGVYA